MTQSQSQLASLDARQKRVLLQQLIREKTGAARRAPLSFAQQRLWFFDQLEPNSALYNVPAVLRLRGRIEPRLLEESLSAIVARHESLRSNFEPGDNSPTLRVQPPAPAVLPLVDLSARDPHSREEELENILTAEIRRPFNLAADPLVRGLLVRLAEEEHVLCLVIHHIAVDEWSLRVLFEEWGQIFRQIAAGSPPTLPPMKVQYRDYTQAQLEWVKTPECERQLSFWREQLDGAVPVQLPADFARPAEQTFEGALAAGELGAELSARLRALGQQEGATLFMTLLAAFKVLIFRYTQQTDITVGCPIAGRNSPDTERLIGFFVNTLALRSRLDPAQSFRQVLRQVREETLQAFASQDLPFDKLVEELHPRRDSTRSPFVQVFFALSHEFGGELFPGVAAEEIEMDTGTAKFDLTLVAKETRSGLRILAEYSTDLFSERRIERLLEHFRVLLADALKRPEVAIASLDLLTGAERAALLRLGSFPAFPRQDCVQEVFEWQVAKSPDAVAVEFGGENLTYRELNARANQLARYLQKHRVGPGALVGVYMERSAGMITAFLGILKAGAAYVPLDLSYPRERLAFMIADTQMSWIVTQRELEHELPVSAAKAIALDADWERIGQESRQLPPCHATADSLACVIYTSGSTGQPKGVCVPHRGISRLVINTDYVKITPADRIAQVSNASFDAATFEIWGALLNGARVVGISKETALAPAEFAEALRARRISIMFLTTALFNQLAREQPGVFATLGTVLFGGETVDPKWVRAVLASDPPKRLLHVYGPTENTTFSTWHLVQEVAEDSSTVPIGQPIANSELYILDPAFNPVPIGVPGEVYVGGDGLAQGYLNRPELTESKFVPHPLRPGAKLYRTGDLARFDDHLQVEFIGRVDRQIKLRGFRIELDEIESQLLKHPAIAETVVILREDLPGDRRLAAYVVPRQEPPAESSLRSFLKEHLPDYMIPAAFVFIKELPLTPNKKIDRHALPAPDQNRPALNKSFVAPRDSTEQQLAKIFEKTLGVQPIGVADNFFELGGHSLLAVRVFAQIEKNLGKKLPLATLFRAPTIEELARILREETQAKTWSTIVDIQPAGSRPPLFWLHTLGGDGGGGFFYYRKLAELLGPDQPSFGIRSPQEPFHRIEEMARFYIAELRKVQPHGPYFLGGFCFGGNVAFEMAQQLSEAGEQIGLVVLLESSPPNVSPKHSWSATAAKYSLENFVENLRDFVGNPPGRQMAALRSKGRRLTQKLRRSIESEGRQLELKDVIDLANYPDGYVKFAETHWSALTNYHPRRYDGHLHLFRARKQGLTNFSHTLGWDALAGDRVHVTVIPGTHESMLQEPNVQIVSAKLRQLLNDAHGLSTAAPGLELAAAG